MTQLLSTIFGELGIAQYLEAFLDQGFDTWETILDITESDFDALGVKLGHRRKLQRRIANSRGIAPEASLVSPTQSSTEELKAQDAVKVESPRFDTRETVGVIITKRKYRRHPKPDENAPERPPSAYVLFSNKMREELKGRNLSFTEIAKLVGENWQNLATGEKEPFESQAQAIKDKYLSNLAGYKKTPEFRKYQAYLHEFRVKHASPSQDKDVSKRLRLAESGSQGRGSPGATPTRRTSRSGSGAESRRGSEPPASRQRVGSTVSTSDSQYTEALTPSTSVSPDESANTPVMVKVERQPSDGSQTFDTNQRDLPVLSGPRHPHQGDDRGMEQLSMQRQLPSLFDVFDGRGLPGGIRPSHEASTFRFHGAHVGSQGLPMGHNGGDARPAPLKSEQQPFAGNLHSYPAFGHPHPRTCVEGPLPIHALLASKPEPTFEPRQPAHPHPHPHQHPLHASSYHVDHKPQLIHQHPNGAGLPVINGYHSGPPLSQAHVSSHSIGSGFPAQPPPPPSASRPQHGKHNASFDGMSALLQAGEIVDRRAR